MPRSTASNGCGGLIHSPRAKHVVRKPLWVSSDSVWEIFGPLLGGVRALIAPDEYLLDLNRFVALLAQHEVTRLVLVPSLLRTLLDVVPDLAARLPRLTLWSISGEALSADLVRRFRQALPTATLLNIYGSSEVAADVTYCQLSLSEDLASIPVGRPISNTQIFILDQYKNLVPPLVHGEIHVGGDCLARGYWKQPELTSQQFIPKSTPTGPIAICFCNRRSGKNAVRRHD